MAERVRFYFDPICPWCYQTSRKARRLEELGVLELDWGVFSLELQNRSNEPEDLAWTHARSELALRTAIAVRDHAGPTGVGRSTSSSAHACTSSGSHSRTPPR